MDPNTSFMQEVTDNIAHLGMDKNVEQRSLEWICETLPFRYVYNFQWMGRPVIQYPQDIVAMQEVIWKVKPDLIIETGIAHGGSLIFSASMLTMLEYNDAFEKGEQVDPLHPKYHVIGIDNDIRQHNRAEIEAHAFGNRIILIQGSSTESSIIEQVRIISKDYSRILVCLDSNHTHDHVLAELEAYAPLVSIGSYCIVFDTIIEDLPEEYVTDRPWRKGNNPKTAVWKYLNILHDEGRKDAEGLLLLFEIDKMIDNKLLITSAPDGYLKRV